MKRHGLYIGIGVIGALVLGWFLLAVNTTFVNAPTPPDDAAEAPGESVTDGAGEAPREDGPPAKQCIVTGCSGQVCSDEEVITTCEFRQEYACYRQFGTCEAQANGECGWTETPELTACLNAGANEPQSL